VETENHVELVILRMYQALLTVSLIGGRLLFDNDSVELLLNPKESRTEWTANGVWLFDGDDDDKLLNPDNGEISLSPNAWSAGISENRYSDAYASAVDCGTLT